MSPPIKRTYKIDHDLVVEITFPTPSNVKRLLRKIFGAEPPKKSDPALRTLDLSGVTQGHRDPTT